ncbi:hypothetical protein, partial [Burkholderia sp. BCC1985]|uniref:hypothetical protein n=1 Tax=Burkholderia sp. BCC1985 TaxID=2817442 RepID=UPI002AB0E547
FPFETRRPAFAVAVISGDVESFRSGIANTCSSTDEPTIVASMTPEWVACRDANGIVMRTDSRGRDASLEIRMRSLWGA